MEPPEGAPCAGRPGASGPAEVPPPAEPPPAAEAIRKAADALAPYLARLPPTAQALAEQRMGGRAGYGFLRGGEGAAYFRWAFLSWI